jgi:phage repressor protein C with HTH and peptisase S24 domain
MDKTWFRETLRRMQATQADLARELRLAPSAISRILTGTRQIKAAEAVQLARYLGVSSEELLKHATADGGAAAPEFIQRGRTPRAAEAILTQRKDMIPILGGAGPGVLFEDQPVGRTPRPPALAGVRGAYAVYAAGDAMEPRYMPGWLLYVHPNKPVIRGRDVVVVRKDSTVLIGQLTETDRGAITIRQFNPMQTLEIPQEEMVAYHLVVGVSHEG